MSASEKPVHVTADARGRRTLKVARKNWIYRVVSSTPESIILEPVGPSVASGVVL
jgi:hypothetical protein